MKIKYIAALAALTIPSIGNAQDAPNWSGFYVGASLGGVIAKSSSTGVGSFFDDAPVDIATLFDTTPQGTTFGLRGGYNFDLGSGWVAGVEGAANSGALSDRILDVVAAPDSYITATMDKTLELKTRVGFAAGQTLIFGTAGMTTAQYSVTLDDPAVTDEAATLKGYTFGAGFEHMLTNKLSLSLEYIHADYGTHTVFEGTRYALDAAVKSDSVRLGMNYRF